MHWGDLDTLLVDMPPGTGDVAMSLGQLLPRAEALVVTTPQPAAQQVAVRAAQMALKVGMRVVGAVENMSYLAGSGQELFGSRGSRSTPCSARPRTKATRCSRWLLPPRPALRSSRSPSPSQPPGRGRSASR